MRLLLRPFLHFLPLPKGYSLMNSYTISFTVSFQYKLQLFFPLELLELSLREE